MKDSDFEQLIASVREAGRIKKGETTPAHTFEVQRENVKVERRTPKLKVG